MACKIDLRDLITQEAQRQGVDPSIALAVAQTESGTCQWAPNGQPVTSSAGAIGVFQLEPATAADLGVDPTDVNQNIRGGITYLKQLYAKYGDWNSALAAYNWGPGNLDNALAAAARIPGQVLNYVKAVLGIGQNYSAALNQISSNAPAGTRWRNRCVNKEPWGWVPGSNSLDDPCVPDPLPNPGAGVSVSDILGSLVPSVNVSTVAIGVLAGVALLAFALD